MTSTQELWFACTHARERQRQRETKRGGGGRGREWERLGKMKLTYLKKSGGGGDGTQDTTELPLSLD